MKNFIKTILIAVAAFFATSNTYSQEYFTDKINQTELRWIDYQFSDDVVESMKMNPMLLEVPNYITEFMITEFGFKGGLITHQGRRMAYNELNTVCSTVLLAVEMGDFVSEFLAIGYYPFTLHFMFCDGSVDTISFRANVNGNTRSLKKPILKGMKREFSAYKSESTSNVAVIPFIDSVEVTDKHQVFKLISPNSHNNFDEVYLIEDEDGYTIVNKSVRFFENDWIDGEYRGSMKRINSTKFTGYFYNNLKRKVEFNATLSGTDFVLTTMNHSDVYEFTKID